MNALIALIPILIIILMAIYSYNILVESKAIEVIKTQFTRLTSDRGVLVLLMVWGFGGLLEGMAGFGTAVAIPAAILIGLGFKPVFSALVALLGNTGFMLLLGSVAGGLAQRLSLRRLLVVLARTVVNLRFTTITIISLIALASVMNHSGMIAALAAGLVAVTGSFYPLFAPLIGAVGTFVTGSDTSSNILFAKLQANVAGQLGFTGTGTYLGVEGGRADWLVASNTTGATGGKMISPQSIAIATAACDMQGEDNAILRKALPYALGYIIIGGLMVYFGI